MYLLSTGNVYSFTENSDCLENDLIEITLPKFTEDVQNWIHYKDITKLKIDVNSQWDKLKKMIKCLPNIKNLNEFDRLLFRNLLIGNNSGSGIYVRVRSMKIGSEEFIYIENNSKNSWKRIDGEYLVEIVTLDMNSYRYLIDADYNYNFTSDGKLIQTSTYKLQKESQERFPSTELIYYDKEKKEYLRKKINYDYTQKKEEITNPSKSETKVSNEEYEYFDGIKPNYIPGETFIDKDFPPNESSLKAMDPITGRRRKPHFVHSFSELSQDQIDYITWKRPNIVFTNKYYLFKDDICYEDVKQGSIGNCYLISILAALSQRPDLIKAVFKTQTINPDGFYELFFYEKGKKKVMFIDDNLILMKTSFFNMFQFAQPNGEELWVMLLEKAYAKYEGGFSNILGGLMYPELQWLTGALTREIYASDIDCWNEILNACKNRNILVTGSHIGTGNHNNKSPNGISNGHAYSILDAKEYRKNEKNIRLLKLRNPWGHTEWLGEFSDSSPLWTNELKEFFEYKESKEDGVFFMPFEDFPKEFNNVIICMIDAKN